MAYEQVPLFTDNEAVSLEKLNDIISNQDFLKEASITFRLYPGGANVSDGIRMIGGAVSCNRPSSWWRTRWMGVSNYFTVGTRPLGFAQLSTLNFRKSTCTVANRTHSSPVLDHTGMSAHVAFAHDSRIKMKGPNYLHWFMIGY